jgi:L-iditol 2-dehydrogenase
MSIRVDFPVGVSMLEKRMWAHVLHKPGVMTLEQCPVPRLRPEDVLVKVEAVLTCGTDLKAYRRGHPIIPLPMTIGHEYSGEVVATGQNVRDFKEGDRIATVHSGPCLSCFYCRHNKENLCESLTQGMVWGGYAQYVRLPSHVHRSNTLKIPDGLSFERLAFLEPVACVLHGINQIDLRNVETAVVLGAGPMGLIFLQMLEQRGVRRVIVAGKKPDRLGQARRLGATHVVDVEHERVQTVVRDLTEGHGADCVVECVGRTEAWNTAVDLVCKGGQVLFYGGCPAGSHVSLDTRRLHYDELRLVGTFHFTRAEVREAFRLLCTDAVSVESLISGEYPLSGLIDAFHRLMDGEGIKFLISPDR